MVVLAVRRQTCALFPGITSGFSGCRGLKSQCKSHTASADAKTDSCVVLTVLSLTRKKAHHATCPPMVTNPVVANKQ
jgi:hypothetical protein